MVSWYYKLWEAYNEELSEVVGPDPANHRQYCLRPIQDPVGAFPVLPAANIGLSEHP